MGVSKRLKEQTGKIVAFGGLGVPVGWLLCNGQSVSRATYPALFAYISTTYGSDSALTFKVPELRGEFIRGLNPDRIAAPALNRGIGTLELDGIRPHNHTTQMVGGGPFVANDAGVRLDVAVNGIQDGETRPRNMVFPYCIKT